MCTLDRDRSDTIFYPFSGPDFPTVHRLYPEARRYIFVSDQKAGRPPRLAGLDTKRLTRVLRYYETQMAYFTRRGFFITIDMNERLHKAADVEGILGLLLMFAELEGFAVTVVKPIRVREDGQGLEVHPGDPNERETWQSARLGLIKRSTGQLHVLEYVRQDLRDDPHSTYPSNWTWLESVAQNRVLLKAASHLMQRLRFFTIRDILLERATTVVQDESGLPYTMLNDRFHVRLFGRFDAFHPRFPQESARALRHAFQTRKDVELLPFELGYQTDKAACMLYAHKRRAKK
jgi:hypothetical protein